MSAARAFWWVMGGWLTGFFPAVAQPALPDSVRVLDEVRIMARPMVPRTGFNTQTLDSLDLRENWAASLGELLVLKTPVFVRSYGLGGLASPAFRGTGASHTQVFWNGVQLNSPLLGQVDLSLFPVALADEVAVDYGGASLLYGTGGLGGSLRLDSRPDWDNRGRLAASLGAGSFGTYVGSLRADYGTARWQGTTQLFHRQARNDFPFYDLTARRPDGRWVRTRQNHAQQRQTGIVQELHYRPRARHTLSARLWYQHQDRALPAAMGTWSGEVRRRAAQQDAALRSVVSWDYARTDFRWTMRTAYVRSALDYQRDNSGAQLPWAQTRSASVVDQVQANGTAQWSPTDRWLLRGGYWFDQSWAHASQYDGRFVQQRADVFGGGELALGRRGRADVLVRQQVLDGALTPFLPSLGLQRVWWQTANHQLLTRANLSRNFRPPTLNDRYWFPVGNPDLRPERGWSGEVGAAWQATAWTYEQTAFHARITDWIVWLPGVSGLWRPENLAEVWTRGLEQRLRLEGQAGDWRYQAGLTYTYVRAENQRPRSARDLSVGRQLLYLPTHNGQATARLHQKGWHLTWEQQYVSRRYVTATESAFLAPYALSNVVLQRDIGRSEATHHLSAQLRVNNLFGYHYQSVRLFPMPGRHFLLTLFYQLKPTRP